MLDPGTTRSTIEWRQARPEDAAIWVSVTRRSASSAIALRHAFSKRPAFSTRNGRTASLIPTVNSPGFVLSEGVIPRALWRRAIAP